MKQAIIFIIAVLLCGVVYAQTEEFLWAQQAGGTSWEYSYGIATDSSGNSYVTGSFAGTATFGTTSLTSQGYSDIFIAKLDPSGNYLWAKQAGGTDSDYGYGIATDSSGNCYVTGRFGNYANFGSIFLCGGNYDIFVTKLDSSGNFLWAKQAGGTSDDNAKGIANDSSGNCYITGSFAGTATFGTTILTSNGGASIFVAKLDTNGNFIWAKQASGTSEFLAYGIATDSNGNSYVTGSFAGTATFGSTSLTSSVGTDIFVTKLDTNGNFLWAKKAGGTHWEYSIGIAIDSSGNCYITGSFPGTVTFGTTNLTSSGENDIFIAKLDSSGNFLWAKQAGGTNSDSGSGIATDSSGNSYVTGSFLGTATFGTTILTSSGGVGSFVAKLDTSGNYLWAKKPSGVHIGPGSGISTDSSGNCYVTGLFGGTVTFGTTILTSSLGGEIFIAKLGSIHDVLAPNGGENWQISSVQTVYWNFAYAGTLVNVLLSVDNGINWIMLNYSPVAASLGRFSFTVPSISSNQCLVKVVSTTNSSWFDISDAPFTISSSPPASIYLTAPTPEKLQTGKSYAIIWLAIGVSTVNLDYSLDAGISWNSIASALPASPGTYYWTVPDTPASVCYIRISDAGNPTVYDWNDVPFTFSSLLLTSPDGGNLYQAGTTKTITWTSAQISSVKLEYSSNGGTSWTQIIASTTASTGTYNWTVPATAADQYLVRVSDVAESAVNDSSDNVFIVTSLAVSYPSVSGIKLQVGRDYNITWNQTLLPGTVKLEFTTNGSTWTTIATGVDATLGTYLWTVPDTPSTTCKVRITSELDALVLDSSDINFTISKLNLNTPNGSESWGSGSVHAITWTSANVTNLKLEYSINDGSSWTQIVASVAAASGTYNWTVPVANSTVCRVRITDILAATVYDISDVAFTIRPQITVTAPNGSESLSVNSIYSVLWSGTADVSFVLIDYSINNGTSWLPLQTSAYPASVGRYDWIVPNNPSANCLVKVRSSANSAVFDVSNAVFGITTQTVPPTVNFTADVTSGFEPLSVQFSDQSIAGTGNLTEWFWEFGDGESSVLQNPLHVYHNAGVYSVCLTATNSADSTASFSRQNYITVLPRYPELELETNTALSFGNIYIDSVSPLQQIWLKNAGTATLAVESLAFKMTNSPFEVIGLSLPLSIAIGDSTALQIRFTPGVAGAVTDSLIIYNNSQNLPRAAIRLNGTGEFVPPKPPSDLTIEMNGYNAVISWEAVTETIYNTPIVPDYYLVFFNGSSNPDGVYYYHGAAVGLQYTHYLVGLHSPNMFYRVIAYKDFGSRNAENVLSKLTRDMTQDEVIRILNKK